MRAPSISTTSGPSASRRMAAIMAACGIAMPLTYASEGEILVGYKDPVGIVTACVGHTGLGAVLGQRYTHAQCMDLLRRDELAHGVAIDACIKVDIPLKVRAAFTDFAFNGGAGGFCGSTMLRLANAGDLAGACAQFPRWIYAGRPARILPGLVTRRGKERALCDAGRLGL